MSTEHPDPHAASPPPEGLDAAFAPRPYSAVEPNFRPFERVRYGPPDASPVVRPSRPWLHLTLLLLTVLSTTMVGAEHYASFQADFRQSVIEATGWSTYLAGFWYSASILSILGAHEMGHYLACRYYRVDATLPFFLPAPVLTGTLGAFIRIRSRIRTKHELFDIGIAGPLAGFAVAVPLLVVGVAMSRVVELPPGFSGLELGEPVLFKLVSGAIWGPVASGQTVNLHPMAFAAWFGLIATALNLFPIGQLDGGHIVYAVFGRRALWVSLAAMAVAVGLTFVSSSWIAWTVLMTVLLLVFGPRHPSTEDEDAPLDRARVVLAVVALLVFVLCFTPAPIEPFDLISGR
ncbi:MAG: site-2 protease family protein [Vicinamibacterales bacterium]